MLAVPGEFAGRRLDQYLVEALGVSRARVQWLLSQAKVLFEDKPPKASLKLRGGEQIFITGEAEPRPVRAVPEAITLDIVYEDDDIAVVNKPAGMMVHAGAGSTDDARNRGTLVNALLHHFQELSSHGGELRPGIVHRLDKETSGLLLVAKHDKAHAKLADMFARRQVRKTYIALVHGDSGCRKWHGECRHKPRYHTSHPHDDTPRRRPHRHQPLPRAAPHRVALRPLHPGLSTH